MEKFELANGKDVFHDEGARVAGRDYESIPGFYRSKAKYLLLLDFSDPYNRIFKFINKRSTRDITCIIFVSRMFELFPFEKIDK